MSDFLLNLIRRSVEAKPAIQPRLPGLFEPVTAEAMTPIEQSIETDSAVLQPPDNGGVRHVGTNPEPVIEKLADSLLFVSTMIEDSHPLGTQSFQTPSDELSQPPVTPPSKPVLSEPPRARSARPGKLPRSVPLSHAKSTNASFPAASITQTDQSPTTNDLSRHAAIHSVEEENETYSADHRSTAGSIENKSTAHSVATASEHRQVANPEPRHSRRRDRSFEQRTSGVFSAAPPQDRGIAPTESRPRVSVSIGRIEIRANLPSNEATPRQKQVSSTPIVELDEYLKQRNSGGRR